MLVRVSCVRVLLTEGSSLTSREVVTCLGPLGYHLEVLDPDPMCLTRFSRWVHKVHRCPSAAADPTGYLKMLETVVVQRGIDVVLPTHEQAWLLAVAGPLLPAYVTVAVADAGAFEQVQSKVAFAGLLDELRLPQPDWRLAASSGDLTDLSFPYWLKAAFGTAGQGVREVVDAGSRDAALDALLGQGQSVMAQTQATGQYGQVQGLFDRGRLLAVHTSVQTGVGVGGSAAARLSVDHAAPREHIALLGRKLGWHGGLTLDYFHQDGSPRYLECNPRTVEPANAAASGVNIPDLQVRLTLGEDLTQAPGRGRSGVRTHGTIALLLGAASRGGSRRSQVGEMADAIMHRGLYEHSSEQLTPVLRDPPSLAPAAFVAACLLISPRKAVNIANKAVTSYSLDPRTLEQVARVGTLSTP
jgi:hypothetical protein